MSPTDLAMLKRMAAGDGELRMGKTLVRSLIAKAEASADRAAAPTQRMAGSER